MRHHLPSALAFASLLVGMMPSIGLGQAEPPEGCFCLAEVGKVSPRMIQRGCSREKFPGQFYWSAICSSPDADGTIVVAPSILITDLWTIIPAGEGDCSVCEPAPPAGEFVGRGDERQLRASRAFGGPVEYPPDDFAGYGIVAFKGRPTLDRGRMFCEAYAATFATDQELVDHGIPTDRQMVTVWPIETELDAAAARDAETDAEACSIAVSQYGLLVAEDAIADANRADLAGTIGGLSGEGPFLLAWAPGEKKGERDVLVLVADLTNVATAEQARLDFLRWKEDIQQSPELWERGWSQRNVQTVIQRWADGRSQALLMLLGLAQ